MDLISAYYAFVEDGLDCKVSFVLLRSSAPGKPMYECHTTINCQIITTRDFLGTPGLEPAKLQLRDALVFIKKARA